MAAARYLNLTAGKLNLKSTQLDMSRYARLDSGIFVNLHLDSGEQNDTSIAKLLSAGCATPQGVRMIRKFVTQPLVVAQEILDRQKLVEYLIENGEVRNILAESQLKRLPDIAKY